MAQGPEEQKLLARLQFKLTGRWPEAVVAERLSRTDWDRSNVDAIMREVWGDRYEEYRRGSSS